MDRSNHYEFHNYTSIALAGLTFIKFGGRLRYLTDANNATSGFNGLFSFSSLPVYNNGSPTAPPTQFLYTLGTPAPRTSPQRIRACTPKTTGGFGPI